MDNIVYLILIGALLVLAAWMLYARFASRSRENSSDYKACEISAEDSTEANIENEIPSSVMEEVDQGDGHSEGENRVAAALVVDGDAVEKKREGEYFDGLQEAAAGLAVLMRSSPVKNPKTPVVFAPEESPDSLTGEAEDPGPATMASEPLAPSPEKETEVDQLGAEVLDDQASEGSHESDESKIGSPENTASVIRGLLGDEVGDRFEKIDLGLDALEELVLSIESGMSALDGRSVNDANLDSGNEDVSRAA